MDTLLTLLLMGILYIGSKIWNSYLSKITKNLPKHSSELPAAKDESSHEGELSHYAISDSALQSHAVITKAQPVSTGEAEKAAWGGKLDQNMMINGVIYAEILQPPRAYRPFAKK